MTGILSALSGLGAILFTALLVLAAYLRSLRLRCTG
jgi:hypothetical protein